MMRLRPYIQLLIGMTLPGALLCQALAQPMADFTFAKGKQPVLWYLNIRTRMIAPRELFFDDLVPEFCLYGDGSLIYRDIVSFAAGKWLSVQLTTDEITSILHAVYQSEVMAYEPTQLQLNRSRIASDRTTTVVGVRVRDGGSNSQFVHEVSVYGLAGLVAEFPEEIMPQRLLRLAEYLQSYQHPKAREYLPEAGELSVVVMDMEHNKSRLQKHSIPTWPLGDVRLGNVVQRGWHHIVEINSGQVRRLLPFIDWENQPQTFLYRDSVCFAQYRPVFVGFARHRTYLPFPEHSVKLSADE